MSIANRVACLLSLLIFATAACAEETANRGEQVVHGRVVDQADKPVPDATLVLVLRHGRGDEDWQVEAKSDAEGRFQLAFPSQWIAPGPFHPSRNLWCYASGRRLTAVSVYQQLSGQTKDPIRIDLQPEIGMKFRVRDPAGKPLAGCRVEPHHWLAGSFDNPPTAIRRLTGAVTDEEGAAWLPAMEPSKLRRVTVISKDYGEQRSRLELQDVSPTDVSPTHVVQLRQVGTIEGQLICDDPQAISDVWVAVEAIGESLEGFGEAQTNAKGEFRIERVAEGSLRPYVLGNKVATFRPRLPRRVVVQRNQTTSIDIPFDPTLLVRGSVVARGSDQPVANAFVLVTVASGERYQSEHALTDAQGRFEVHVLPGEARQQLIMMPTAFHNWLRAKNRIDAVQVAADSAPVELPPLEIVPSEVIHGSLVDRKESPLPESRVSAYLGEQYIGMGLTDKAGLFEMHLPLGAKVDRYLASVPANGRHPLEVVSESPLRLRLADLLKLASAKVTVTPTPEGKRQPAAKESAGDLPTPILIVAENVILFDGRTITWGELADKLEKMPKTSPDGKATAIHYHITRSVYRDPVRKLEAKNWAELLSESTGIQVRQFGLILNQAAARYDAIQMTDQWPPGADKPVVGRVVSPTGDPVAGAQVVLLLPPPPTSRLRSRQSISLRDGRLIRPINFIVTESDAEGRFQFEFPAIGTSVMVLAPQGFVLANASEEATDLQLQPWARVTGTLAQQKKAGAQSVSLSIAAKPAGGGEAVRIHMSAGSSSKPLSSFEFVAVPPLCRTTISRTLWHEEDGQMLGRGVKPRVTIDAQPAMTTHVELGPLSDSAINETRR